MQVSIIIPAYNCANFIKATLDSCIRQTFRDLEIIVIDDGSTDNTAEIVNCYNDKRIAYYKTKNSGPCSARNFGLSKASGDLIQFLDHDDILELTKIDKQVSAYKENGDSYIYSSKMGCVLNNKCLLFNDYGLYEKSFTPLEYYETVLNQFGRYITTGAWLIPKKIITKTYGWDERAGINDDGEYFMRLILNSAGIIFCNEAVFYFRRDIAESLSKNFETKEVYKKWLFSYKSYAENFQLHFAQAKANELGWKALSIFYCNTYPKFPDLLLECRSFMKELGYNNPNAHGGEKFIKLSKIAGTDTSLYFFNKLRVIKKHFKFKRSL